MGSAPLPDGDALLDPAPAGTASGSGSGEELAVFPVGTEENKRAFAALHP